MVTPSPAIRDLAQRLLAVEAASKPAADPRSHEAIRVFEKLRVTLTRLAGTDGFTALLRRALALARTEVAALQTVTLKSDGSLEGFKKLSSDVTSDASLATTAHLLGLLVTFIGEPLTLQLLRETWPDASFDE